MTAARSDAVLHAPATIGEWPVAPRFAVAPVAAPIAVVPDAPLAPQAPVTVEPEMIIEAPQPVAVVEAPAPVAVVEAPEPVAVLETEAVLETQPVVEAPAPVFAPEAAVTADAVLETQSVVEPEAVVEPVVEPEAVVEMPEPVALLETEAVLETQPVDAAAEPVTPVVETPVAEPVIKTPAAEAPAASSMPAPYAPIMVAIPAPVPVAEPVAALVISPIPTLHAPAPQLASPLQPVPDLPAAPVMPAAPIMAGVPQMPGMPDGPHAPQAPTMPGAPIQLPTVEQPEGMSVAEWPIDRVADLRPDDATPHRRFGSLPSLPEIPGVSHQFLLVAALAGAAGFVAIRGLGGGDEPAAPAPVPAQVAAAAGANWQASVPKTLGAGDVDALTLDQREVRPARMRHQLELAVTAMKPGEVIRELTIRTDGTLMLSVVHGTQERTVVTKGTAPVDPPAAANAEATPILAIDPIEVDPRVPRKLLRAVEKAKGVDPTSIDLVRSAAIRGGQPTWVLRWAGVNGKPSTAVFATQDGRQLATTSAALGTK